MHAPGYPPPRHERSATAVIALRVLFAAIALVSFAFFAWVTLLRLAVLRRRTLDWALMWASVAVAGGLVAILARNDPDSPLTGLDWFAAALMFTVPVAVTVYYLVTDIRHHQQHPPRPVPYPLAGQSPAGHPPVAYGPPVQPPAAARPGPPPQPGPPLTSRPSPHPLDQVRAELDELSDYLRKDQGGAR